MKNSRESLKLVAVFVYALAVVVMANSWYRAASAETKQLVLGASTQTTNSIDTTAKAGTLHEAANEQRAHEGLARLAMSPALMKLAQQRADDMVANNYYAHKNSKGQSFVELLQTDGVNLPGYACENLNLSTTIEPKATIQTWLASTSGHRECLLSPNVKYVGYATSYLRGVSYDNGQNASYISVLILADQVAIN